MDDLYALVTRGYELLHQLKADYLLGLKSTVAILQGISEEDQYIECASRIRVWRNEIEPRLPPDLAVRLRERRRRVPAHSESPIAAKISRLHDDLEWLDERLVESPKTTHSGKPTAAMARHTVAGNGRPAETADESLISPKAKRSTGRGKGQAKLVAALTKHHQYADSGCLNLVPIISNELARWAEVSPSTANGFFNHWFGSSGAAKDGYTNYKVACADKGKLIAVLKSMNGELPRPGEVLFGRPPGEGQRQRDA